MSFPYFAEKHDPNAQDDWSSPPFTLNPGESIVDASVTVVDGADNPIVDDSDTALVVFAVSFAALTDDEKAAQGIGGNAWQVTFWLKGGLPGAIYFLRFRVKTDSTPFRSFDRTRRMRCRQT